MKISAIAMIGVFGGLGLIFLLGVIYKKCRQYRRNAAAKEEFSTWKKTHHSVLTANFVKTFTTPISDTYVVEGRSRQGSQLGKGSYGVVYMGYHRDTAKRYAIKLSMSVGFLRHRVEREYKLLKDIDHPNVVRLYAVYDSPAEVGFVMELCTGGNLQAALMNNKTNNFKVGVGRKYDNTSGLAEFVVKPIMRQLMSAVAHIHSRGICHRDIKLENIMIENKEYGAQIKLIDFGLGTRFIGATPIKTSCGSPLTMAPEVHRKSYDERCDVWSAGVVCFWLLSGKNPFLGACIGGLPPVKTVITNVLLERYKYHRHDWKYVSMPGIEFTQNMLLYNYKHRWHATDALKDPWLSDNNAVSITDFYGIPMDSVKSQVSSVNGDAGSEDDEDEDVEVTEVEEIADVRRHSVCSTASDRSTSARSNDSRVQHAVMNLKRQADLTALEKTSKLAMAFTTPSSKHADLRAFFQMFDEDNNGTLSRDEFRKALMACNVFDPASSEKLSVEDIDLIFEAVDLNKDGEITLTEFIAASLDPRDFDMHAINTAFQLLDTDNKGYIIPEDIERVLSATSAARRRSRKNSMKRAMPNLSGILDQSADEASSSGSKVHKRFYGRILKHMLKRDDSKTMSGDSQHSNSEIKRKKSSTGVVASYFKQRMRQMRRNRRMKRATVAAANAPVPEDIARVAKAMESEAGEETLLDPESADQIVRALRSCNLDASGVVTYEGSAD